MKEQHMNRLKDKVVLITGGTSGIGLATAKLFAEEGAKTIFITGRRQSELHAAVEEIGAVAVGIRGDVSKLSDIDSVIAQIKQKSGHIDVVFSNAGVAEFQPLTAVTEEHFDRMFDINVKGTVFTIQNALPLLRDGSSIILNSSVVGTTGNENLSIYSATKAAVRNLARCWILELKGRGIRVNAVSPGATETPGLRGLVPSGHEDGLLTQLASKIPLGRVAAPREIAQSVLFLASDESSFVNGIELNTDGGEGQF
jgi:NAD(P)-dependent dehydrogenase (short-subunit alcohol dehydrogenase family)